MRIRMNEKEKLNLKILLRNLKNRNKEVMQELYSN